MAKAIVVGSGAGGSTAAMVLARRGWDVIVLEKGANYLGDLRDPAPATRFSNDEVKSSLRFFEVPDYELAEPRTFRRLPTDAEPLVTGMVNHLPSTVGGGTIHWDAKTPRFWDIDFKKRSLLGPSPGADVQDWPFEYADLAPYYDEIERLIGVQGDIHLLGPMTKKHSPYARQFAMPPGPPVASSPRVLAGSASTPSRRRWQSTPPRTAAGRRATTAASAATAARSTRASVRWRRCAKRFVRAASRCGRTRSSTA